MAHYNPRPSAFNTTNPTTTSIRSSLNQPAQSPALQARINQKRAELENLQQLRDLSANLTHQLEALEHKLGSLKDGAQSVALVLANWENVLGVIRMAGMRVPVPVPVPSDDGNRDGKGEDGREVVDEDGKEVQKQVLPVPLVRIPIQVQQQTETGG